MRFNDSVIEPIDEADFSMQEIPMDQGIYTKSPGKPDFCEPGSLFLIKQTSPGVRSPLTKSDFDFHFTTEGSDPDLNPPDSARKHNELDWTDIDCPLWNIQPDSPRQNC